MRFRKQQEVRIAERTSWAFFDNIYIVFIFDTNSGCFLNPSAASSEAMVRLTLPSTYALSFIILRLRLP